MKNTWILILILINLVLFDGQKRILENCPWLNLRFYKFLKLNNSRKLKTCYEKCSDLQLSEN